MLIILKKLGLSLCCFLLPVAFIAEPASAAEVQNKAEVQQKIDQYVTKMMKISHI